MTWPRGVSQQQQQARRLLFLAEYYATERVKDATPIDSKIVAGFAADIAVLLRAIGTMDGPTTAQEADRG